VAYFEVGCRVPALPGGTEVKHRTISVVKVGVLPKLELAFL